MKKLIITILLLILFAYPVLATQTSSVVDVGINTSVRIPTQDFGFYAAGRFWVFYFTKISTHYYFQYKSSTDNITWNAATIIKDNTAYMNAAMNDVYFDGTNVHYIRNNSGKDQYNGLYYRRGVPQSDGTIIWAAGEQTIYVDNDKPGMADCTLTVDSNGYPWIGMNYKMTSGGFGDAYVIKSSTNNGTWTTAFGYPKLLSNTPPQTWTVKVVSQTAGKIYAIIYATSGGYQIYGYAYDGANWGTQETVTTSVLKGDSTGGDYDMMDAISIGDDIHLVFQAYSTNDIRYVKRTAGSWSAEQVLVPAGSYISNTDSSPVLTAFSPTQINMFWIKRPVIYYETYSGGAWDTTVRTFLTDNTIVVDQERCLQAFNTSYMVGTASTSAIFYLPGITTFNQTLVTYTALTEDAPPEEPPPQGSPTQLRTIFKNNIVFKSGIIIKD